MNSILDISKINPQRVTDLGSLLSRREVDLGFLRIRAPVL